MSTGDKHKRYIFLQNQDQTTIIKKDTSGYNNYYQGVKYGIPIALMMQKEYIHKQIRRKVRGSYERQNKLVSKLLIETKICYYISDTVGKGGEV